MAFVGKAVERGREAGGSATSRSAFRVPPFPSLPLSESGSGSGGSLVVVHQQLTEFSSPGCRPFFPRLSPFLPPVVALSSPGCRPPRLSPCGSLPPPIRGQSASRDVRLGWKHRASRSRFRVGPPNSRPLFSDLPSVPGPRYRMPAGPGPPLSGSGTSPRRPPKYAARQSEASPPVSGPEATPQSAPRCRLGSAAPRPPPIWASSRRSITGPCADPGGSSTSIRTKSSSEASVPGSRRSANGNQRPPPASGIT